MYNNISVLKEECPSCKKKNHLLEDCPLFGIRPETEKLIENLKILKNNREIIKRNSKRINTIKSLNNPKNKNDCLQNLSKSIDVNMKKRKTSPNLQNYKRRMTKIQGLEFRTLLEEKFSKIKAKSKQFSNMSLDQYKRKIQNNLEEKSIAIKSRKLNRTSTVKFFKNSKKNNSFDSSSVNSSSSKSEKKIISIESNINSFTEEKIMEKKDKNIFNKNIEEEKKISEKLIKNVSENDINKYEENINFNINNHKNISFKSEACFIDNEKEEGGDFDMSFGHKIKRNNSCESPKVIKKKFLSVNNFGKISS